MSKAVWSEVCRLGILRASLAAGLLSAQPVSAQDAQANNLIVVFDASGSMWGQVDGTPKIDIARNVFTEISGDWVASGQPVGLIAYGHRRKGDCSDIELLTTPSNTSTPLLADFVNGLTPRGKTPLSQAVRMAAEELKYTEDPATVILLSDGRETCDLDPCEVGATLEQLGVDFTAHVIGFDIREQNDRVQLQCLAESTGGTYVDARDASSLTRALNDVTSNQDEPAGTTRAHITIAVADGTVRPATVTLTALNPETGDILELGQLAGAGQVISGLKIDMPHGDWTISANGDGGQGEVEVALNEATQEVRIPFAAGRSTFEVMSEGRFETDGTITFALRSLEPLQQNATFAIYLYPTGAAEYDEYITFTYRFGNEPDLTEHYFSPWEYGLAAGEYEIIVLRDGDDLADDLGRLSVTLVEPSADIEATRQTPEATIDIGASDVSDLTMTQLIEPLSPGTDGGLVLNGAIWANDTAIFIGLDGQATVTSGVPENGIVRIPEQIIPGTYRVHLSREDGTTLHLDVIDILPASAQDIAGHASNDGQTTGGESAETMLSEEELAAETGAQDLPFIVWTSCDTSEPCRVADRRVNLEWILPSDWASEEPFYYTTAGGAASDKPTVHMARARGGAFNVVLNPRQWDPLLGPCEDVGEGILCHEQTDVVRDQSDLELIRNSLNGNFPKPFGWQPLARSWTIQHRILGGQIGLLKISDPQERADTATALLKLSNPEAVGASDTSIVEADLALIWDRDAKITDINGFFEIEGGTLSFLLSRPNDWDSATNEWVGQIISTQNGQALPVILY